MSTNSVSGTLPMLFYFILETTQGFGWDGYSYFTDREVEAPIAYATCLRLHRKASASVNQSS